MDSNKAVAIGIFGPRETIFHAHSHRDDDPLQQGVSAESGSGQGQGKLLKQKSIIIGFDLHLSLLICLYGFVYPLYTRNVGKSYPST